MSRINLDAELTRIEIMSLDELRVAWSMQIRTTPPKVSSGLLRLALAHHIQSKVMGGVTKAIERKLQETAAGQTGVRVNPGTRLVREWQGKLHVVSVSDEGRYRWQDRDWKSLSQIAREITGTRWSGPLFFGTKGGRKVG